MCKKNTPQPIPATYSPHRRNAAHATTSLAVVPELESMPPETRALPDQLHVAASALRQIGLSRHPVSANRNLHQREEMLTFLALLNNLTIQFQLQSLFQ